MAALDGAFSHLPPDASVALATAVTLISPGAARRQANLGVR